MESPCECPICYEVIEVPTTGRAELSCGHAFHIRCIADWFATANPNTCPMCRKEALSLEVPSSGAALTMEATNQLLAYIDNTIPYRAPPYANIIIPAQNEMGLNENDIQIVMRETLRSREAVIRALAAHGGDIVEAIMVLVPGDLYA